MNTARPFSPALLLRVRTLLENPPPGSDICHYNDETRHFLASIMDENISSPIASLELAPSIFYHMKGTAGRHWPSQSWWEYSKISLHDERYLPYLHFGCVIINDIPLRCAYFNSRHGAIDPLGSSKKIEATCYIGARIEKRNIEDYFYHRDFELNPLELFVKRKTAMLVA